MHTNAEQRKRKQRIQLGKISVYAVGIIALAWMVIAKIPSLRSALDAPGIFGDLHLITKIDAFKIPITPGKELSTHIEDADIIMIGDSFFDVAFNGPSFPTAFAEETQKKVHNAPFYAGAVHSVKPSVYFEGQSPEEIHIVEDGESRILVWEQVERNLVAPVIHVREQQTAGRDLSSFLPEAAKKTKAYTLFRSVETGLFDEDPYAFLLSNSKYTEPAVEALMTTRYKLYHDLPATAPEETMNPDMLYFGSAIEYAETPLSENEIQYIADQLSREVEILQEQYNLEVILLLVPSKPTVYRIQRNREEAYNNLLPRVASMLEERKVATINLLTIYDDALEKDPTLKLYHTNDTHWNQNGIGLAVQALEEKIETQSLQDSE